MKGKIFAIISVVLFLIIVILCGILVYKEVNGNDKSKTELCTKDECNCDSNNDVDIKVYDVNDSLLGRFMFGTPLLYLDDAKLLPLFYGDNKDVKVDDLSVEQKFYLALEYYVFVKDISLDTESKVAIKLNDLEGVLFEDSSYLDKLNKPIEEEYFGEYAYYFKDNTLYLGGRIFGAEGPSSYDGIDVISAYTEGDRLYININYYLFSYVDMDENGIVTYEVYDGFKKNKIGTFDDYAVTARAFGDAEFTKHTFEYKIVDDNYYFVGMTKK